MYITREEYAALYDPIEEKLFNRISYDAGRAIDHHTTGVDGFRKLREAFPTDPDAATAIKRCAAELIYTLLQFHEAEQSASFGRKYVETEMGAHSRAVASASAGGESVTYSEGKKSAIDAAAADPAARDMLIAQIARRYLTGVTDANGVNLLYMSRYPV